jgi:hypothetical protein
MVVKNRESLLIERGLIAFVARLFGLIDVDSYVTYHKIITYWYFMSCGSLALYCKVISFRNVQQMSLFLGTHRKRNTCGVVKVKIQVEIVRRGVTGILLP